jgi:hypothetical protein
MNITNLFGNWLNGIDKKTKERIHVGVCALVWTIWNCRNEVVFNRCVNPNFLQVGFIDSSVVIPSSYGAAGAFGYWMQSLDGGFLGYIQPGWLVAL